MAVMRSRLLDPLERNRLDATVDVRVSARCGTSADILLSPPPTFQTLSVLLYKVPPATETFRFPRATFVMDKTLHSGFFVLCITDMMSSLALRLFCLTITPTRATHLGTSLTTLSTLKEMRRVKADGVQVIFKRRSQ